MPISHQLILELERVLKQGPYDGLQFRVGGQQIGAEYLQPHVGQAVHYADETDTHQKQVLHYIGDVEGMYEIGLSVDTWLMNYIFYRRDLESWTWRVVDFGWTAGLEPERVTESWMRRVNQEARHESPDARGTDICKHNRATSR